MIYNKISTFEYSATNMRISTFFGCICAIQHKVVNSNFTQTTVKKGTDKIFYQIRTQSIQNLRY